jgi:TPR repeat protein
LSAIISKTRLPSTILITALAAALLGACATGSSHEARGPAPSIDQPERLLAHARNVQAEKGCDKAIPTYRVLAGFGEGYEVAQYELGACLLETAPASEQTVLLTQEGLFWLRRAAWAGNARAQWRLAMVLSGAPSPYAENVAAVPTEAMGWALVYKDNATRELYGLAPVYPKVLNHLKATLPQSAKTEATTFADDFVEVKMAIYTPPARGANAEQSGKPPSQGQHGPGRHLKRTASR